MDAFLRTVVDDPDAGRERPTALLARFDADDEATRLGAVAALGAVAEAHPDTVDYFASRLADRHDEDAPAVAAALQYLLTAYPERTRESLADRADTDADEVRPVGSVSLDLTRTGRRTEGGVRVLTDAGDGESTAERDAPDERSDEETNDEETRDDGDERSGSLAAARDVAQRSAVADVDQIMPAAGLRHADAYDAIGRLDGGTENVLIKRFESADPAAFERGVDGWERVADHRNVVGVHDWGRAPEPWAVVEYSTDTLAGREPLSPAAARDVTVALARAVAYAHQRDVVHGGIEPRSVVLAPGDGTTVPKLTNVGLAPELEGGVDPRYAAPECFDDARGAVDARTDTYHLGALAYALFTGDPPFDGDGGRESRPAPPSEVVPSLPSALDDVIATATATEKFRRYRSVERFANQLAAVDG
ncbi:MAG: protein kinase [Halobacteriaceae archaeon]